MKDLKNYNLCSNPIAGRGERCYEGFRDHVKTIIELEQNYLEVVSKYSHYTYIKYLNNILNLENDFLNHIIQDINTFLAAFHDIGKCTIANQRTLYKRGVAPYHEFFSTCILGIIVEIGLGKRVVEKYGSNKTLIAHKALAPLYLAIVLHHHAMRGGELKSDVISERCVMLKTEDAECSWKCLGVIEDLIPIVDIIDKNSYIHGTVAFRENISKIIRGIFKELYSAFYAYRVAVLLSSVLLVADVIAAKLNRECHSIDLKNEVLERELVDNIYIREFLKREKLFKNSYKLIEIIYGNK